MVGQVPGGGLVSGRLAISQGGQEGEGDLRVADGGHPAVDHAVQVDRVRPVEADGVVLVDAVPHQEDAGRSTAAVAVVGVVGVLGGGGGGARPWLRDGPNPLDF
jgi:hypothetical protein